MVKDLYDAEVFKTRLVQRETVTDTSPLSPLSKLHPCVDIYGVTTVIRKIV